MPDDSMATLPPPSGMSANVLQSLGLWLPDIYGKLRQHYQNLTSQQGQFLQQATPPTSGLHSYGSRDYSDLAMAKQLENSGFAGQNKSGARSLFDFLGSTFGGALPNPEQLPPQRSSTLPAPEQLPYSPPTPLGQQPQKVQIPSSPQQGFLYGMTQPGNIDLTKQPVVQTAKGPATVRSMSFTEDGVVILVPTVANGRELTTQEAIDEYHRTGKHLGKFTNPADATRYSIQLHQAYESGQIPGYER